MTVADKLQLTLNTKNEIKSALILKGADLTNKTFAQYPEVITNLEAGGGGPIVPAGEVVPIGTIFDNKMDIENPEYLVCDGSLISQVDYPELYSMLAVLYDEQGISYTAGSIPLPDYSSTLHGDTIIPHIIKAKQL